MYKTSVTPIVVILLFLFSIPAFAQNVPRVGVAPLLNTSDDPGSDALAETISRAIGVNLDLLGGYEVDRIGAPLRNTTPANLDALAASNEYDNVVFGSIARPDARTTEFRVALYDRAQGAVTYDNTWSITSIFEVFDTADLVVEAMLDQFSDERLVFGQLAITNTGVRGDYRVYINDVYMGENIAQSRVLSGSHSVRVEQRRMFGPYLVFEEQIQVPENGTGRVQIDIPGLTEREAERLESFEANLAVRDDSSKAMIDFGALVNNYITLISDLEDATYSAQITDHRRAIEERFDDFVAWYSRPTVIVEEIERVPEPVPAAVSPGRPVAAPGSGGILFRYSRPLDRETEG